VSTVAARLELLCDLNRRLATFGSLDDGTSYAQQTLLDVKKKKIQVNVTNTGYRKSP